MVMADIRYEKILQRQGLRSELPTLDSGEFGFTTDTSQVFIGTDPSESTVHMVVISPFPNAQKEIQSLLNSNASYSDYTVSEFLQIQTTTQSEAADLVNFINSNRPDDVARVESNVEILTNLNVNAYINPSDFNAVYNAETPLNPHRSLLTKVLNSSDAGIFLEFDFKQVFHVTVKYTLVQNDGWHRRSGVITLLGDNSTAGDGQEYIGFDDEQTLMNAAIDSGFIRFDADVDAVNNKIRILFEQPSDHTTKIYYRIERWNIASVVTGEFTDMPTPPPNQVLGVEDGALGLYGDGVLGINRGNN